MTHEYRRFSWQQRLVDQRTDGEREARRIATRIGNTPVGPDVFALNGTQFWRP